MSHVNLEDLLDLVEDYFNVQLFWIYKKFLEEYNGLSTSYIEVKLKSETTKN